MTKVTKAHSAGHSIRLIVPKGIAAHLGLKVGDFVSFTDVAGNSVELRRVPSELVTHTKPRSRSRLNLLLGHAYKNNGEIVAGGPAKSA